jgi:hypothetical protein
MAVRHLKRYASWVQTVQLIMQRLRSRYGWLHGLSPEVRNDKSRRSYIGIYMNKSTNIGGTQSLCVSEGNTEGKNK